MGTLIDLQFNSYGIFSIWVEVYPEGLLSRKHTSQRRGGNLHTDVSMNPTVGARTFIRSSFTRGFILFTRDMLKDKRVGRYEIQKKTASFTATTWQKHNIVPP